MKRVALLLLALSSSLTAEEVTGKAVSKEGAVLSVGPARSEFVTVTTTHADIVINNGVLTIVLKTDHIKSVEIQRE